MHLIFGQNSKLVQNSFNMWLGNLLIVQRNNLAHTFNCLQTNVDRLIVKSLNERITVSVEMIKSSDRITGRRREYIELDEVRADANV